MKSREKLLLMVVSLLLLLTGQIMGASSNVQKKTVINGHSGAGPGQVGFKDKENPDDPYGAVPSAIAIDTKGNVYIADIANERVVKFNSDGMHLNDIKYQVINDMATDSNDNLYIANSEKASVDKYSSDGEYVLSVDLKDKDIRWREKKGWTKYPVQIERMMLDLTGNIYLQGANELIKIDKEGNIKRKWAGIRASFLDEANNLYLMNDSVWKKYDQKGSLVETPKCEKPLFRMAKDGQCMHPQYIDKNGFLYFYEFHESGLTTKGKDRYVKVDKNGKRRGEYYGGGVTGANRSKFDANGNLYFFLYKDDKFWVEKITWN